MAINPRRTNGHLRSKLRRQVLAEEDACGVCGKAIDKTLTMAWGKHGPACKNANCPGCSPHPQRAEVDEIVPVSQGGSPYERSNLRLTHRACNQARNRRDEHVARASFPTSRAW